jgi:hypothetical protein
LELRRSIKVAASCVVVEVLADGTPRHKLK